MTRKDYEKIARVFASTANVCDFIPKPSAEERGGFNIARHTLIKEISDVLQEDNDRFDKERFYKACE